MLYSTLVKAHNPQSKVEWWISGSDNWSHKYVPLGDIILRRNSWWIVCMTSGNNSSAYGWSLPLTPWMSVMMTKFYHVIKLLNDAWVMQKVWLPVAHHEQARHRYSTLLLGKVGKVSRDCILHNMTITVHSSIQWYRTWILKRLLQGCSSVKSWLIQSRENFIKALVCKVAGWAATACRFIPKRKTVFFLGTYTTPP